MDIVSPLFFFSNSTPLKMNFAKKTTCSYLKLESNSFFHVHSPFYFRGKLELEKLSLFSTSIIIGSESYTLI